MSDQSWEALSHSNRNLTVDKGTRWINRCCKPEDRQIKLGKLQFSSVQFSHSVMSDSLRSHEPQHVRPPCPSPTPRVYPNSCPLSWWCHPTISSSVVCFSSCPQSFPASGSFQMSQLFSGLGGYRDDPKMKYVMWVDQTPVCFQVWGY